MRGIQERYNRFRENQKRNLNNKLATEQRKYAISKEKHLQDVKQEQELQQAKAFKKYEGYVSKYSYNNILIIHLVLYNERKTCQIKRKEKIRKRQTSTKAGKIKTIR